MKKKIQAAAMLLALLVSASACQGGGALKGAETAAGSGESVVQEDIMASSGESGAQGESKVEPSGGGGQMESSDGQTQAPALTVEQMKEDLDTLCDTLEKKHKNMYANVSKEEFLAAKTAVEDRLHTLSPAQFYFELKALVAMVGDAHTDMGFMGYDKYEYLTGIPFAIGKLSDEWYLLITDKEREEWLGSQVLAVNGVEIEKLRERAKAIISHENEAWVNQKLSNTINFKEALEWLDAPGEEEGAVLTLQKYGETKSQEICFPYYPGQGLFEAEIVSFPSYQYPTAPQGIYWANALSDEAYYIQYNQCVEAPDLPMKDFAAAVKQELESGSYKKVLVDLRYNSGGNSNVINPLLGCLQEMRREKDLQFYTLIGERTFSSGIMNAIQLKRTLLSELVGEPTGGNVNGYGEILNFELPNLPVKVTYSTKYFAMDLSYDKDSLYPDIEVRQSMENELAGVDYPVEMILTLE